MERWTRDGKGGCETAGFGMRLQFAEVRAGSLSFLLIDFATFMCSIC
jgi:hypothetical protein